MSGSLSLGPINAAPISVAAKYSFARNNGLTACLALVAFCILGAGCERRAASIDEHNAFIEIYQPGEQGEIGIAIKDNIDIAGKVTSAGSLALKNNVASDDAFLIQRLRQAGFHIFGKTNLSEWANFRSTNSVSGWSSLGGQTTHVGDPQYNPCGSSSGSAVAVASGLVEVAIGTETNGSISCPASVNGVVGMKPTVGLVSRHGVIPIASSQDTAGPNGKNVAIVAQTLAAIAGPDANDSSTAAIPDDFDYDFASTMTNRSLAGKRFGLLDSGSEYKFGQAFLQQLEAMVLSLGGSVVKIEDQRIYPGEQSFLLLAYEFKRGLEAYLATATESKKALAALIEFNQRHSDTVMPHFGQEIFLEAMAVQDQDDLYQAAKTAIAAVRAQTLAMLEDNSLDGFIGLTRGPAWRIDYVGGDDAALEDMPRFGNGHFAAISGLPHITIPAFVIDGFPVGISVIGKHWSDKSLLAYAAALEAKIVAERGLDTTSAANNER